MEGLSFIPDKQGRVKKLDFTPAPASTSATGHAFFRFDQASGKMRITEDGGAEQDLVGPGAVGSGTDSNQWVVNQDAVAGTPENVTSEMWGGDGANIIKSIFTQTSASKILQIHQLDAATEIQVRLHFGQVGQTDTDRHNVFYNVNNDEGAPVVIQSLYEVIGDHSAIPLDFVTHRIKAGSDLATLDINDPSDDIAVSGSLGIWGGNGAARTLGVTIGAFGPFDSNITISAHRGAPGAVIGPLGLTPNDGETGANLQIRGSTGGGATAILAAGVGGQARLLGGDGGLADAGGVNPGGKGGNCEIVPGDGGTGSAFTLSGDGGDVVLDVGQPGATGGFGQGVNGDFQIGRGVVAPNLFMGNTATDFVIDSKDVVWTIDDDLRVDSIIPRQFFQINTALPKLEFGNAVDKPAYNFKGDITNKAQFECATQFDVLCTFVDNAARAPWNITERNAPPGGATAEDVYLDDGTNTGTGNPGFRRYTGAVWENIDP